MTSSSHKRRYAKVVLPRPPSAQQATRPVTLSDWLVSRAAFSSANFGWGQYTPFRAGGVSRFFLLQVLDTDVDESHALRYIHL